MKDDIVLIIWNNQDKHDKIWGVIRNESGYVNFWGPRGAKNLMFQRQAKFFDYDRMARKKVSKGYHYVGVDEIEAMNPGFCNDLEEQYTIALIGDRFHGE